MFNDETDILKWRLEYLQGAVDVFVVAESNSTFSGNPKPFYFDSIAEFAGIDKSRVIRVKYEFPLPLLNARAVDGNNWPLEQFGRNSLLSVINSLNDDEIVILSDVDEIPSLSQISVGINQRKLCSVITHLHYGKLNWLSPDGENWNAVKIGPAKFFNDRNLNELKHERCPRILGSLGGHYSDQFSAFSDVASKMNNSAHSEYQSNESLHEQIFNYSLPYRINHFGRFKRKGLGLIKTQPYVEMNDFQFKRMNESPELFDFSKPRKSWVLRCVASYLVTKAWETRKLKVIKEREMYLLLPFVILEIVATRVNIGLVRSRRVTLRRIQVLRNFRNRMKQC